MSTKPPVKAQRSKAGGAPSPFKLAQPDFRLSGSPAVPAVYRVAPDSAQATARVGTRAVPPPYRPEPRSAQATPASRRGPIPPPVFRPNQSAAAQARIAPASRPAATPASIIQRQLAPGEYKTKSYANIRAEHKPWTPHGQVKINARVIVLDKAGRTSLFKAGWKTNEHSWVQAAEKDLLNSAVTSGTLTGWINDDNLVAAIPSKQRNRGQRETQVVEEDQTPFEEQVGRLYATFFKGSPGGLQVSQWLIQLGASLAAARPGSLGYDICEDASKSGSLAIIGDTQANLKDTNWVAAIIGNSDYRKQYPSTVSTYLREPAVPVPAKYVKRSVREWFDS